MTLFEKLFCKHKWSTHNKKEMQYSERFTKEVLKEVTIEILICEKCGKIKQIEY